MQEVKDFHYDVTVTVQLHPADWFSLSASGVFLLMEEKMGCKYRSDNNSLKNPHTFNILFRIITLMAKVFQNRAV